MLIVKLKRTLSLDFLENWASNDLILYFCFLSACRKNHTTDSCPCLQRLFHFFFTSEFLSTHTFLFSSREPRKIYQTSSWFGKIPRPPSSATHPRGARGVHYSRPHELSHFTMENASLVPRRIWMSLNTKLPLYVPRPFTRRRRNKREEYWNVLAEYLSQRWLFERKQRD